MNLLEITDDLRAYPAPELVEIKALKALIQRDKGQKGDYRGDKKLRATRELAYIYHCIHHDSPYANEHYELREEKVREDVFQDEEWEPDEIVIAAMKKYKKLLVTPAVNMLNAGMKAAQKLTDFFNNVDLTQMDKHDRPKFSAKDLVANLGNLGRVVEGLTKLREQVENETIGEDRNRRSVETNKFSV
ncbi:hypothetical protein LCGC14_2505730 [marine sediment metagenome]|uniref:Uncharacterized protein n=1 Tax=marine sediment metagenome TaxID=412755 RepID=A0A0F9DCB8_9ZZZZ